MKTTRKTVAPAHPVTAQRMPLRQCNNSNMLSSKKVLNGEVKIDFKRSTQSSNKRQNVLSFEKNQSIKENLPVGMKKSVCYKFTSSPVNCENDNALDVYDIYLDKDMEDTGCTKKIKRKVKRKEPVVVRAKKQKKTPHTAKSDNVCPLHEITDSLKDIQNTCPIAKNVDDLTSEPKLVSSKSSKDVNKVSIINTCNAGLKVICTNTDNLCSERTTDVTSDLQQEISNIQNSEVRSSQKQTVPSNPIILETSCNSVDKSHKNVQQSRIGSQCSVNIDFYSEFESSFSILEMMHSTPEKITSGLSLLPNNQRICQGIDIISPILKNISSHVAGINNVQGSGCVNLHFDAESEKSKKAYGGIFPLKGKAQISANAKKKQVATNKNDCTHSLGKRSKTTRKDKSAICPITGRVLMQAVINSPLDAEMNENLVQGNNPVECCDPHFVEITLYESPVKLQETDKSNSLEKSTRKIPGKRLLDTSNKYLENSEDDYGSIHLFEDCSLPKLKQRGSPMQEMKEKVLKPKRAYHTPEQFRRHLFKSKRAGVIAVQKKKTDTKLDHWASSLNDHFEEIDKIDLCIE